MTGICPSCGFNLTADTVIERDGFVIDPRGGVMFQGTKLFHRSSWSQILMALAKDGRTLSGDALLSRISESEKTNLLASHVSQLRKFLRTHGVPDPIETVRNKSASGYRWHYG